MTIQEDEDSGFQVSQIYATLIVCCVTIYVAARPMIHALHRHFFLEPDSVGYMSLGASIWHGEGFADFSGGWCSDWPPFYPCVVGLCERLNRWNDVKAIGIVGGSCLALTLLLANAWLSKLTKSAAIRCAAVVALAFSVPLTNLANSGLSEVLFIPLSLACIYFVGCFQKNNNGWFFVLAILSALLCCMTRYIGVTVVAAAVLAILIAPNVPSGKKAVQSLWFIFLTMTPFLLWCLINKKMTGTFMGERQDGQNTLRECLAALVNCLNSSLVDPIFVYVLAGAALCGFFIWLFTRREDDYPFMRMAPLFVLFYAAVIVYSSARYNIDMVDDRLTSPLFVPLVAIAVGLIEYLRGAMIRSVAISVAVGTSAFFLLEASQSIRVAQIPDGGYLSTVWQQSNTLAYVSRTNFSFPLNSNDSAATYLLGHKVADWVADDSDTPTMTAVETDLSALPGPCYVVWLYNAIEPANFDPNEIVSKCNMQIVATFNDGVIFERTGDVVGAAPAK